MSSQTQSVSVSQLFDAPIWRVYQRWKRLERFPEFVPFVKEARWLDKEQLYWREEHDGVAHEFVYEVKISPATSSLTWRTISGAESSGTALIEPQSMGRTLITLSTEFTPDATIQDPAIVQERYREFLVSFKRFIESRPSGRAE